MYVNLSVCSTKSSYRMHTDFRRKRKLTAVLEDENNDERTHALKNARMVWLKIIRPYQLNFLFLGFCGSLAESKKKKFFLIRMSHDIPPRAHALDIHTYLYSDIAIIISVSCMNVNSCCGAVKASIRFGCCCWLASTSYGHFLYVG